MKIGILKNYDPNKIYEVGEIINPLYVFDDVIDDTLYDDITSLVSYDTIYIFYYDIKRTIFYMIEYLNEKCPLNADGSRNLNNLTEDEIKIACKYFLLDYSIIEQYFTPDEIKENWSVLNLKTKKCRQRRWDALFNYLSLKLEKVQGFDLAFTVDKLGLSNNYLMYGLESESIDGVPGLFDYFEGTSIFAQNGFPSKPYWTQELQNEIMKIIKDGIY